MQVSQLRAAPLNSCKAWPTSNSGSRHTSIRVVQLPTMEHYAPPRSMPILSCFCMIVHAGNSVVIQGAK